MEVNNVATYKNYFETDLPGFLSDVHEVKELLLNVLRIKVSFKNKQCMYNYLYC